MFTRRALVVAAPLALAGCASAPPVAISDARPVPNPDLARLYEAVPGEPYPVPAVDISEIDPKYLRQLVTYPTAEQPGAIVVDPQARFAYLIQGDGRAIRYGVGVGREEAFNFQGVATIRRKAAWPRWTPTPDMIRRDPDRYVNYAAGLPGGSGNPLGPRALYLYKDGQDSLYRLHGTVEPATIGTMVSSGCVRFLNQDIIDLYQRVPVGTRVVVLPASASAA